jgi:hypothetical protein
MILSNLSTVQYFDPDGITYPYNISVTQGEIDVSISDINAAILNLSSSISNISSSGGGTSSIATTSSVGIIKVGNGLKIDATGSLSIDYDALVWGGM